MKVNSALILCAGYAKRLQPITNDTPKSLLKIKNINLLDNTLNFVKSIGISNIKINTFYLGEKIKNFIENKKYPLNIELLSDGEKILDTGGGIFNLMKILSGCFLPPLGGTFTIVPSISFKRAC